MTYTVKTRDIYPEVVIFDCTLTTKKDKIDFEVLVNNLGESYYDKECVRMQMNKDCYAELQIAKQIEEIGNGIYEVIVSCKKRADFIFKRNDN